MSKVKDSAVSTQDTTGIDNESIVLSSILNDNSLMEDIELTVNDFTVKENKAMFLNMQNQYAENQVIEILETLEAFDTDLDSQYIIDYIDMIQTSPIVDITKYINRMKEASKKQAIEDSMKKYNALSEDKSSSEALAELSILVSNFEEEFSTKNSFFDIQNLSNVQVEQPDFYLEDFLPIQKNEITMISAGGGSGKSYLGILLLAMLKKEHDLNIFAWFSEDPMGIVKHRANKLEAIYGSDIDTSFDLLGKGNALGFTIKDRAGNLQASEFFYAFKKQMKEYDVILLDPLIQFIGNIDENNNGEIRFFFNLLNTWCEEENKTLMIIHHHNKGNTDKDGNTTSSFRGASAIVDAIRVHYSIIKKNGDEFNRYCKVEKANHFQGKPEYSIELFAS